MVEEDTRRSTMKTNPNSIIAGGMSAITSLMAQQGSVDGEKDKKNKLESDA
jgi:hypothetical protein